MKKLAPLCILLAGVLWGSMGLFVKSLAAYQLSSLSITAIRLFLGGLSLFLVFLLTDRKMLRMDIRDIGWFLADAVCSVVGMSLLYFTSILHTSMSVAAILLYTAPVFVMLMSAILFKERITVKKIIALIAAVGGSVLVAGLGGKADTVGILSGIGSGFCYALYSIFGVRLLKKYHPFTVTTYTFLFAGITALTFTNPISVGAAVINAGWKGILLSVGMALVTAAAPYLLYTLGLRYMEAGKASVLATVEPMMASVLGILVYREAMTPGKGAGILLILAAVAILSLPGKASEKRSSF